MQIQDQKKTLSQFVKQLSDYFTRTEQANACNRLHAAELSVTLCTVLKLKLTRCEKWK